jgi:RNA polymerase sigma-70 factor (ECF subfamily)
MERDKNYHPHRKIDEQYMQVLFKTFYKNLCLFARQYINDIEKCEDIVQDVFLNIWEKGELIDSESQVKGYLFTSVKNRCLNFLRDHKKFSDGSELPQHGQSDNSRVEYAELEKILKTAIESLPEKCREIFEMSRFRNLKYQEIADKLGLSIKTVEAQMSKALRVLRNRLSSYTDGFFLFILQLFSFRVRENNNFSVL